MAIIDSLQKISDTVWELPATYRRGMRVPARIIATEKLVREMDEAVYEQISNVATLPGITRYALCMPDGHSGYGFPIGGVAAMDIREGGVISPGGIGFDINCGMRLVVTNLTIDDVRPHLHQIVDRLYERVPAGVGSHGFLKLSRQDFRDVVEQGARWCIEHDYGWEDDLEVTEENGCIRAPMLRRSANAQLIGVTTKSAPSAAATITLKCRSRDQKTCAINSSLKNWASQFRTRSS